jgi:hypothetical protein
MRLRVPVDFVPRLQMIHVARRVGQWRELAIVVQPHSERGRRNRTATPFEDAGVQHRVVWKELGPEKDGRESVGDRQNEEHARDQYLARRGGPRFPAIGRSSVTVQQRDV